jgi:hypothetical protein
VGRVVEAVAGEFLAQRDDQVDGRLWRAAWAGVRPPRVRDERGVTFEPVALDQPRDHTAGGTVSGEPGRAQGELRAW